jgi:flagellar protein FlgJ
VIVNLPAQAVTFLPFGVSGSSKALPLEAMQKAISLEPSLASKAADQVVLGQSGLSHLTKGSSAASLNPLRGLPTHSDAEIQQVSKNFESIFLQMVFKEMRNSVQKSNLLGNSQGMEFFESMYDEKLTQQLASSGGMGLGQMVYQKLKAVTVPHQKTFS